MKTTVTKKQITEATTVNKLSGWHTKYGFRCTINGVYFEKPQTDYCMYVTYEKDGEPFTKQIIGIDYKKEFIQEVYNFMNDMFVQLENVRGLY